MKQFPIGVMLESFRLPTLEAMDAAVKIGAQGIQMYATRGENSPENLNAAARKELLMQIKDRGMVFSAICGDLGMGFGNEKLIQDLLTVKYSINPYNVNSMTMAAGLGALEDEEYTQKNCKTVAENRDFTTQSLRKMGFTVLDSAANFVMAAHPAVLGGVLYEKLKERGILVRYFNTDRLSAYVRITIGSAEQMEAFLAGVAQILEETK